MQIESSNNSKKRIFLSLKIEKENIHCKDGFCSLPIKNENSLKKNKVNFSILFN